MNTKEHLERSQKALDELAAYAKSNKKHTAIAYDECAAPAPASKSDVEYLEMRLGYLRDSLDYFRETFYEHLQGHLPKITGAGQLTKALKVLGLDGDYEVQKKTIYANDGTATSENFVITKKG